MATGKLTSKRYLKKFPKRLKFFRIISIYVGLLSIISPGKYFLKITLDEALAEHTGSIQTWINAGFNYRVKELSLVLCSLLLVLNKAALV